MAQQKWNYLRKWYPYFSYISSGVSCVPIDVYRPFVREIRRLPPLRLKWHHPLIHIMTKATSSPVTNEEIIHYFGAPILGKPRYYYMNQCWSLISHEQMLAKYQSIFKLFLWSHCMSKCHLQTYRSCCSGSKWVCICYVIGIVSNGAISELFSPHTVRWKTADIIILTLLMMNSS